jgi:hypothetical protein
MYDLNNDRMTDTIDTEKGNNETGKTETRKGSTPIYVWVTPTEKQIIHANAKACGMSNSEYLRQVGLGMPIKSILDQNSIADLAKVNADQGRLGGLLKLWLTNDEKLKLYDRAKLNMNIIKLLEEIKRLQALLFEKATSI